MVAAAPHDNRVGLHHPNDIARAQTSQNTYPQYHPPTIGGGGGGGYHSMTNFGYSQGPTATHPPGAPAWSAGAEEHSDGHESGSISSVTNSSGAHHEVLNYIQVLRHLDSDAETAATIKQLEEQLSLTLKSEVDAKFLAWKHEKERVQRLDEIRNEVLLQEQMNRLAVLRQQQLQLDLQQEERYTIER
jgi:hypothetical protein